MQEVRYKGLVKHIGVSNFEIWHLEKVRENSGEFPEVNQIEFHPWIYKEQAETLKYCHANRIRIEGYSPLAQGYGVRDSKIKRLAEIYETTSARVILKWCMQHNVLPIVGSRDPQHLKSNAEPYNFELSDSEMKLIDNLASEHPIRVAELWNWNSKTASLGGPLPKDPSWRSKLRRLVKRKW